MRLVLLALIAAAVIFLSGCAQNQVPDACSPIASTDQRDNCVYKEAVLSQEPFRCYNIEKSALRESCLADSTDEAGKKKVKKAGQQKPPAVINITVEQPNATAQINRTEVAQKYAECFRSRIPDVRAACLQGVAIDRRDIGVCTLIEQQDYRRDCVTNIAQLVRNPQICEVFNTTDRVFERDLCNTHSKVGEIT